MNKKLLGMALGLALLAVPVLAHEHDKKSCCKKQEAKKSCCKNKEAKKSCCQKNEAKTAAPKAAPAAKTTAPAPKAKH